MNSEFTFTPGVNAIIGIMGSGKTSIVQALTFGLFGTFPALQSRKITLDDLIMNKPQKRNSAEISMEFQAGGKLYSVRRVIETGKGTTLAEIREDGKLTEVNPQGVNRVIQDTLQMDYDLFSKAVYSEQNSLDYFLTIPKGQRTSHIDRMLKLDRFEKAREGSVSLVNRIGHGKLEKAKFLEELEKDNLESKVKTVSDEVKELNRERSALEKDLIESKKGKDGLQERVKSFDRLERRFNEIKIEMSSVEAGIKEIEENLKSSREKLRGMDPDEIPKNLEKLEKEISILGEEIEKERSSLEESRNNVASLNAEIATIKEQIDEMNRLGDRCPTCESSITDDKRNKLTGIRKGKEIVLRNKVNNLVREMGKKKERVKLIEDQIRERSLKRESINSLLGDMDYVKGIEERKKGYEEKSASMEKELNEMQTRMQESDIKAMREDLQEMIASEREIMTKLSGIEEKINDRKDSLNDLKKREEMLRKYKDGMKRDEEIAGKLNTFVKVLKVTQDQLREEFLKNVNHSMGMIWKELYPYGDLSGVRLAIDKDYVLQVKGSDGWMSVDGVVSGGERSIACLALRIAFSMALVPNLKWLILDEPTHNLDINAIEQFTSVLREKINNFVGQVFLITHEERVSEGVMGSLYKLERNKEINEPTKIMNT
jgi:exonuclease SbcC